MWDVTSEMRHSALVVLAAVLVMSCIPAGTAHALGDILFPGSRSVPWPARNFRIEVSDAELFGIAGLRSSGVRATAPVWMTSLQLELVRTGNELAAETRATLRVAAGPVAIEAGVERAVADARSASLTSMGVRARLPVGARTVLLFHAGGIGVAGIYDPGFDAEVALVLRPAEAVRFEAALLVHRRYGETLRLAAEVRAGPPLALRAGFDAAAENASAGIRVRVRAMSLEVGADVHAVLGLSQRVSLIWGR